MNNNTVSIEKIKMLRNKTLIGIKECKIALLETSGDIYEAEKLLRKKGILQAERRINRNTENGKIFVYENNNKVAMVELTCETEFVAQNKVFCSTGEKLVNTIAEFELTQKTVIIENIVKESISILKENMIIKNIIFWNIANNEVIGKYIHNDGQMVSLIKLRCRNARIDNNKRIKELADDLAMHICASNPKFINNEHIEEKYLQEQREIYEAQALKIENIDENMRSTIVSGKLRKHFSQICLLEQKYIKDENKTIKELITDIEGTAFELVIIDFALLSIGQ